MDHRDENWDIPRRADGTPYVERRKRTDWVVRSVQIISVIAWSIAFMVIAIVASAKPKPGESMFTRLKKIHAQPSGWDKTQLQIAFLLLVLTIVVSIVGMILNAMRQKRKTDKVKKSLIVCFCISVAALVTYIILFGGIPF